MYVEVLNNNIIGTLRQFLELLYLLGTRMSEHEEGEGWGNSLTGLIQTELELLLPALAESSNIYLDRKTKTVVCMRVVSASDGARVCPVSHRCWQMAIIPNTRTWDTAKYASWRGTLYLKLFYLTFCHYPVRWHPDIDIVRVSLSKPVLTLFRWAGQQRVAGGLSCVTQTQRHTRYETYLALHSSHLRSISQTLDIDFHFLSPLPWQPCSKWLLTSYRF